MRWGSRVSVCRTPVRHTRPKQLASKRGIAPMSVVPPSTRAAEARCTDEVELLEKNLRSSAPLLRTDLEDNTADGQRDTMSARTALIAWAHKASLTPNRCQGAASKRGNLAARDQPVLIIKHQMLTRRRGELRIIELHNDSVRIHGPHTTRRRRTVGTHLGLQPY